MQAMIDDVKPADHRALIQGPEKWAKYAKRQTPGWRPSLSRADLTGADLTRADLAYADLGSANLTRAHLNYADLGSANLTRANLNDADLAAARLTRANLNDADLTRANLNDATLTSATLTGANLTRAKLTRGDLTRANLTGANLTRANLTRANLTGADLSGAHLNYADLTGARLTRANLTGADLTGANLNDATLAGATLTGADLTRAILTDADLTSATLAGATLNDATLTGATLAHTMLVDLDVSFLCGSATHRGPSYVDQRSVIRSHTNPALKQFLLECGVPWIFAEYMIDCAKAVTAQDLRALMQSTFISYGQPDDAFARRLYDSLLSRKITVFYFPETARWGERLSNEVYQQLNKHDRVILVCSKDSLRRPGVLNEIQETFDREARDGGADYLLPIGLDDYLFDPNGLEKDQPAIARRIRARIVGDFRSWQLSTAEYDKSLNRLIDALKKLHP